MHLKRGLPFLLIGVFCSTAFFAQATFPSYYIDKGACPYERCGYGKWRCLKGTSVYEEQNPSSRRLHRFKPGEIVTAVTGEIHTIPGRLRVLKDHWDWLKAGDVVYLYTYIGEGYYKIWFQGEMMTLDFTEGIKGSRGMLGAYEDDDCAKCHSCWANLEVRPISTWWVQVRLADGTLGWCKNQDSFEPEEGF